MSYLFAVQDGGITRALVNVNRVAFLLELDAGNVRVCTIGAANDWQDGRPYATVETAIQVPDGAIPLTRTFLDFSGILPGSFPALPDGRVCQVQTKYLVSVSPYLAEDGNVYARLELASEPSAINTLVLWGANGATAKAAFDPPPGP
jgi:hypothetical protein